MKKHGVSHGVGAFVSVISATALSCLLEDTMPDVYAVLFNFSALIKNFMPFTSEKIIGYAILASIIMFLWGVGFYFTHRE